jgi:hypothetical protein
MSPEEREQLNRLCMMIQVETNQVKLSALLRELNDLLEKTQQHFAEDAKKDPLL